MVNPFRVRLHTGSRTIDSTGESDDVTERYRKERQWVQLPRVSQAFQAHLDEHILGKNEVESSNLSIGSILVSA